MRLFVFISLLISSLQAHSIEAVCLPDHAAAKSWPVKAIYLHGLMDEKDNTNELISLEVYNRKKILALAEEFKFRIALPIGPIDAKDGLRKWNHTSFQEIEKLAVKACNTKALAKERYIIGFSNGGYAARRFAQNCELTKEYVKILAIGAPKNTRESPCRNGQLLVNTEPHILPEMDYFITHLKSSEVPQPRIGSSTTTGSPSVLKDR